MVYVEDENINAKKLSDELETKSWTPSLICL